VKFLTGFQSSRFSVRSFPFYYGWIILPAAALATFMSAPGQTYGVSVFIDPMIDDLGWSRNLISSLYTGGSLTAACLIPFVGKVLDRFGGRVTLTTVAALFGIATFLVGSVVSPLHLFIGIFAIRAFGQGSLQLISTTLVAMWFVRRRGRAMALNTLASPASHAVFPVLIFFLISSFGWRSTWMILGTLVLVTLVPIGVLIVRRSPESVGLEPDIGSANASQKMVPTTRDDDWMLGQAMRVRTFWILLFLGLPWSMISTGLTFHHIDLLGTKGFDVGLAAAVLSFMAPMGLLGTVLAGFLCEKIPERYVLAAGQALLAVSLLCVVFMSETWHGFLYGGMLGFGTGAYMTTTNIIWPNYFGRANIGTIKGIVQTGMVASAAMGPLPISILASVSGNYDIPILTLLVIPICACIVSFFAIPPVKNPSSE